MGASAGVGRALAEELARRGSRLVLVASDPRDLEALAADLILRFGVDALPLAVDLNQPEWDAAEFEARCSTWLQGVDTLLVPAGAVDPLDLAPADRGVGLPLIRVNYLRVVEILNAFAAGMLERRAGDIVAFSSIAAARGRGRNTVYASAKAGLETYCEGLRHGLVGSGVRVQVYALGYVDSAMSYGLSLRLPVASPAAVARFVVSRLGRDQGLVYFPRFWRLVAMAVRLTPWSLFRRLSV